MVRASLVQCTCAIHNCRDEPQGYTLLPRSTRQSHRDDDVENSLRRLSVSNLELEASTPESPASIAINDTNVAHGTLAGSNNGTGFSTELLKSLLDEYQTRQKSVSQLTEILTKLLNGPYRQCEREGLRLREHVSWMTTTACNLKSLSLGGCSISLDQQRHMLIRILQRKIDDIQLWERACYDGQQKQRADKHIYSPSRYDSEKFFKNSLAASHPLVLLSMFIGVVLNVIHELPERSSNYLLEMQRDLLKLALDTWNGDRGFLEERTAVIMRLPINIRTVRSRFGLDSLIRIFAACPKCSALFEPKHDVTLGIDIYPMTHCNQKDRDGLECGAALLKRRVRGKLSVEVPSRPYGYYSLHDFVGEMLSRPKMEELLERLPSVVEPEVLTDVFDGKIIREFRGPHGELCFQKNGDGSDLYLAWALSVDWYNPYHNKIAGKHVSIGVISMTCLNLPLAIRYEIPNMYLVGIIPGPREPSLERVNNFMAPVIKDFKESWSTGIQYTRTYKHANGRKVVSILIPLVADLPASRKVSGTVGHQAACFCPLCSRKKSELSDFSIPLIQSDREQHLLLAKEWNDAKTLSERVDLARKNGVRHSVVFDLPYWEPRFIVVDTMHNIFLGIIKHHFREVMGIKYEKQKEHNINKGERQVTITTQMIGKILDVLKDPQGPTKSRLKKFSQSDLSDFVYCQKLTLPAVGGNKLTKDNIVELLMSCELVDRGNSTKSPGTGIEVTDSVDGDELPFSSVDDTTTLAAAPDVMAAHTARIPLPVHANSGRKPRANLLVSPEEIEAIQTAIRMTCRPSWQQRPPNAFGTNQQGKLKADQWRTLIEFDLPVALVELWVDVDDPSFDKHAKDRHLSLVNLTMELATAVYWGTSRRTSSLHAATYLIHLQRYLQGLLTLNPRPKLVSNHHFALHVGELLLLFGPVQGWWAYPYERLIGALQKINTNYRIGEIELTLMRSFYASAHLQRLVKTDECPSVLSKHLGTLERHLPSHAHGSYGFNVSQPPKVDGNGAAPSTKLMERLDDDIYNALCSLTAYLEHPPKRQFLVHRSYVVGGITYTSREFEQDSVIFYGSDKARSPAVIRKIFVTVNGTVMFAIHPYIKIDSNICDPFTRWPEFRAGLWSQRVDEQVQLLDPNVVDICHAARRPWRNQEIYVLRPIDRNY